MALQGFGHPLNAKHPRLLVLAIAILLAGGGLLSLPSADAQAPTEPGSLAVVPAASTIGPAQVNSGRVIFLSSTATADIASFELTIPRTGTGTSVRELRFRDDSQALTFPTDWTFAPANAPAGSAITGNPSNRLLITGVGTHTLDDLGEMFRVRLDASGNPTAGSTFAMTIRSYSPAGVLIDQVTHTITVDNTAPKISTTANAVQTRDLGPSGIPNGHIDAIDVTFDSALDPSTLVASDFSIPTGTYSIISAELLVNSPGVDCSLFPFYSCPVVRLNLQESLKYDTGAKPKVQYTQGSLTDLAANKASNGNKDAVDFAPPLLVAATAQLNSAGTAYGSTVLLRFSENVHGGSTITTPIAAADLEYYNTPTNCAPGTTSCTQSITSILHSTTGASATPDRVTVTLNRVLTAPDADAITGDRICPEVAIKDVANNAVLVPPAPPFSVLADPYCPVTTRPAVVEAEVNIGSLQLTLRFNGPVETQAGTALRTEDLVVVNTEIAGGGPTGIERVQHQAGADRAVVTMNYDPVRPTDVDQTPSKIRILDGVIKGSGSSSSTSVAGLDVPMVDRTPPAILYADTLDSNGNGLIDGYVTEFSEPINDAVFSPGTALLTIAGHTQTSNVATRGFTFDTGVEDNDRFGIISFVETGDRTGVKPEITSLAAGLFEDLACGGSTCTANPMQPIGLNSLTERDGADPVLLAASTTDSNGNGILDGYVLTFSEAVQDSTYSPSNWQIEGRTPGAASTGAAANDDTFTLGFASLANQPDTDARPQITYQCPAPCLTGVGLQDLSLLKNPLQSIDIPDVDEVDNAAPVIVTVQGFEGDDRLEVVFSEPVDDGGGGPVVRGDFYYSNVADPAPAEEDGVSGFSNSVEVQHVVGGETAIITLNAALTEIDIVNDRLQAGTNTIRELAPHKAPAQRLYVPATSRSLNEAPDVTAPTTIADLAVVGDLLTPTTVRLTWTAPADDVNEGNVTGYLVKYSTAPITATNFDLATTAVVDFLPAPTVDAETGLNVFTGPGRGQDARVLQLAQATLYHFAVKAIDEAGNQGAISNTVQATTLEDLTRPEGELDVRSPTHPEGQARANANPRFQWNELVDQESVVRYRYARNTQPGYEAKGTDNRTDDTQVDLLNVPPGTWYFHVAAESEGGRTPTDHYRFIVAYPVIPSSDFVVANTGINTSVVREDHDNIISWVLPASQSLPGTVQGVKIWRLEDGVYTQIKEIDGSYAEVRAGNYTDEDGDRASDRYLVTMVFRDDQDGGVPDRTVYAGTKVQGDGQLLPTWVWILLGVVGALIIAGLIVFFVLRSRAQKEAMAKEAAAGGYQWEEEGGQASGTDPKTGLPIHDVKCPSCAHQFQATGNLPLQITCPNCGVGGALS